MTGIVYLFHRIQIQKNGKNNTEYFPEHGKNLIMLDVLQSQPIKNRLAKDLILPQSLIIANFDSPVYATNYSLRMSKNVAYKLEGKHNHSAISGQWCHFLRFV